MPASVAWMAIVLNLVKPATQREIYAIRAANCNAEICNASKSSGIRAQWNIRRMGLGNIT